MDPAVLEPYLEEVLTAHPSGLGEYDLLRELRARGVPGVPTERLGTGLRLFHTHFLLFHTLYLLRDRLHAERRADIEVDPLCIVMRPYIPGRTGIVQHDPVRAYYLDFDNLTRTREEDVTEMLAGIYRLLERRRHRAAALAELGLSDPVDDATIKRRYRRLAMKYHPDRGGDNRRLQAINRAIKLLAPRTG